MFLPNSRYFRQQTIAFTTAKGRQVKALKLRRLPTVQGTHFKIKDQDRLDILAHRNYGDATRFWHIADANTDLDAKQLVSKTGRIINIPIQ